MDQLLATVEYNNLSLLQYDYFLIEHFTVATYSSLSFGTSLTMPSQMSRVEQELNELRQKHLAKNQRDKLKNGRLSYVRP